MMKLGRGISLMATLILGASIFVHSARAESLGDPHMVPFHGVIVAVQGSDLTIRTHSAVHEAMNRENRSDVSSTTTMVVHMKDAKFLVPEDASSTPALWEQVTGIGTENADGSLEAVRISLLPPTPKTVRTATHGTDLHHHTSHGSH